MRSLWLVVLVLAALVAMPTSPASATRVSTVDVAPALPAGCNSSPAGTLFPGAAIEPEVAANPRRPGNLVTVYQQDRWSNGGANAVLASVSRDGGRGWMAAVPPAFSRCAGGDYDRASNPWVSFGRDGIAYYSALGLSNDILTSGVLVSRSTDGGRTWGGVTTLSRDDFTVDGGLNDRPVVTADPTLARHAYVVWTHGTVYSDGHLVLQVYFSRTTDGGATWSPRRLIYDPGLDNIAIGSRISVLPNGTLVHTTTAILPTGPVITVQRSTDRGMTWQLAGSPGAAGTRNITDPRDNAKVRTAEILTAAAVDRRPGSNRVYLAWQDARFTGGTADAIVLSRSDDGGLTWTAPVRVSPPASQQAFTPAVAVDVLGRATVAYYDFTFDSPNRTPLETDFWATRSNDGGATFAPRERITRSSFDMRLAPLATRGYLVGDNPGLVAIGPHVRAVYATTSPPATTNLFSAGIGNR